jgi:adhesin transport system membrane fusion protein
MLNLSKKSVNEKIDFEYLYSLRTIKTNKGSIALAKWLVGMLIGTILFMFIPWQQNIDGLGDMTALTPSKRPQKVESIIGGRIESWKIKEGQFVNAGDTIVVISEVKEKFLDPELLERLQEQIVAKEASIEAKESKSVALRRQIAALRDGMEFKLSQTDNKVDQMRLKVTSDSTDFLAEKVNFEIAQKQFERQQTLYDQGLKSLTELENRKLKQQEAGAKVISVQNKYFVTKNELVNSQIELNTIAAEYLDKISKAESDLNSTLADIYDAEGSLSKLKNEYASLKIRNSQYNILAPQSGFVVQAQLAGIGETLKEGESIVTIVPQSPDIAAELFVKAMDVPLITKGRKVRLEFDGWPALQFSGWPNAAVGTFGGIVTVIDYVDSKNDKFRLLITPDPDDIPWPKQLRLGSGVKGWVMLDTVPLWYEIWRQLNGFPPSLKSEPDADASKVGK